MGPANVLQPVLAGVRHDAEYPRIESPANLAQMGVRLYEGLLENVLGYIRTSSHAQGVPVQRVTVPNDKKLERVSRPVQYSLDNLLVEVSLIDRAGLRGHGCYLRLRGWH